jgi:hypothetical protein
LQVAGISWAFIRSKLVNIFGEQKIAYSEKTIDVVRKFVTEGIMGIWDWIKDSAQSLMTTMIDAMKGWLLTKLVVGFAEWIVSLLIPGGGILKLVQGIYKLVMWFVDNIQRILRWVNAVLDSLGNVAMGAISAAIGFIVGTMKIIIPVILDFFAKLLNISGIVDAVKNIINKIVGPIHKAIDKMLYWDCITVYKTANGCRFQLQTTIAIYQFYVFHKAILPKFTVLNLLHEEIICSVFCNTYLHYFICTTRILRLRSVLATGC